MLSPVVASDAGAAAASAAAAVTVAEPRAPVDGDAVDPAPLRLPSPVDPGGAMAPQAASSASSSSSPACAPPVWATLRPLPAAANETHLRALLCNVLACDAADIGAVQLERRAGSGAGAGAGAQPGSATAFARMELAAHVAQRIGVAGLHTQLKGSSVSLQMQAELAPLSAPASSPAACAGSYVCVDWTGMSGASVSSETLVNLLDCALPSLPDDLRDTLMAVAARDTTAAADARSDSGRQISMCMPLRTAENLLGAIAADAPLMLQGRTIRLSLHQPDTESAACFLFDLAAFESHALSLQTLQQVVTLSIGEHAALEWVHHVPEAPYNLALAIVRSEPAAQQLRQLSTPLVAKGKPVRVRCLPQAPTDFAALRSAAAVSNSGSNPPAAEVAASAGQEQEGEAEASPWNSTDDHDWKPAEAEPASKKQAQHRESQQQQRQQASGQKLEPIRICDLPVGATAADVRCMLLELLPSLDGVAPIKIDLHAATQCAIAVLLASDADTLLRQGAAQLTDKQGRARSISFQAEAAPFKFFLFTPPSDRSGAAGPSAGFNASAQLASTTQADVLATLQRFDVGPDVQLASSVSCVWDVTCSYPLARLVLQCGLVQGRAGAPYTAFLHLSPLLLDDVQDDATEHDIRAALMPRLQQCPAMPEQQGAAHKIIHVHMPGDDSATVIIQHCAECVRAPDGCIRALRDLKQLMWPQVDRSSPSSASSLSSSSPSSSSAFLAKVVPSLCTKLQLNTSSPNSALRSRSIADISRQRCFEDACVAVKILSPISLQVSISSDRVAQKLLDAQCAALFDHVFAVTAVSAATQQMEETTFGSRFYERKLKQLPTCVSLFPPADPVFKRQWQSKTWLDSFHDSSSLGRADKNDHVHRMRVAVMLATLAACRSGAYETEDGQRVRIDGDSIKTKVFTAGTALTPVRGRDGDGIGSHDTEVVVLNTDCFIAARDLAATGLHPVVLNMASATSPGGGYRKGDGAQEENLFRRSNYYLSLDPQLDTESALAAHSLNSSTCRAASRSGMYPLHEFGGIHTSGVTVFRGEESAGYPFLDKPYTVDCIAVAAYRHPELVADESTNTQWLTPETEARTRAKIVSLFRMALTQGHDSLVLSALGCGAFRNPPVHLALIFRAVLDQFHRCFRKIVFAVIDDHNALGAGNFKPFHDTLHKHRFTPHREGEQVAWTASIPNDICDSEQCAFATDSPHAQSNLHTPECPFGAMCVDNKTVSAGPAAGAIAVHERLFIHQRPCSDAGMCSMLHDDRHCRAFTHPVACRDAGQCRKEDREHLRKFTHVPQCRDGMLCPAMKKREHALEFRHLQLPCRSGTHCPHWRSAEHVQTTQHPFLPPCPHTPYGCDLLAEPTHTRAFSHVCPFSQGGVCKRISDPTHLSLYLHPLKPACEFGEECRQLLLPSHRVLCSHPGVLDFPSYCNEGDACENHSAAHRTRFKHPTPMAPICPSASCNFNPLIDFRRNRDQLLSELNEFHRGRVEVSPCILTWLRCLRPVHHCSFNVFQSIITHGTLMSMSKMADIEDFNFTVQQATLHNVQILILLQRHSYAKDAVHAFLAMVIKKKFAEETKRYDDEQSSGQEGVQSGQSSDSSKHAKLSVKWSGIDDSAYQSSKKSVRSMLPKDWTLVEQVAEQLAQASIDLVKFKEAINYDVDKKLGTNHQIFSVIGPHTAHYYGDVSLVLDPRIMSHVDFSLTPIAGTSFYTALPDQERKTTRSQEKRPWTVQGNKDMGAANDECVAQFHRSKLHPATQNWEVAVGLDLVSRVARHLKRAPASIRVSDVQHWWNSQDSHFILEGHLPPVIPLQYIRQILMPSNWIDKLKPHVRQQMESAWPKLDAVLVAGVPAVSEELRESLDKKRDREDSRIAKVKWALKYGVGPEPNIVRGYSITLAASQQGETVPVPMELAPRKPGSGVPEYARASQPHKNGTAAQDNSLYLYFRARGSQFFVVLEAGRRGHIGRREGSTQDSTSSTSSSSSSSSHSSPSNPACLTFFIANDGQHDESYISLQPPCAHQMVLAQAHLQCARSANFNRGVNAADFQEYCLQLDYAADRATLSHAGATRYCSSASMQVAGNALPRPLRQYCHVLLSAREHTAFEDIRVASVPEPGMHLNFIDIPQGTKADAHAAAGDGAEAEAAGAAMDDSSQGAQPGAWQRAKRFLTGVFGGGSSSKSTSLPLCTDAFSCVHYLRTQGWLTEIETTERSEQSEQHVKAFRHPCPHGSLCRDLTQADHARECCHHALPMCRLGPQCTSLMDSRHRNAFGHAALPHLLIPCKHGQSCKRIKDEKHTRRFAHMTQKCDLPLIEDNKQEGQKKHARENGAQMHEGEDAGAAAGAGAGAGVGSGFDAGYGKAARSSVWPPSRVSRRSGAGGPGGYDGGDFAGGSSGPAPRPSEYSGGSGGSRSSQAAPPPAWSDAGYTGAADNEQGGAGVSVFDSFYNACAGSSVIEGSDVAYDAYKNPKGASYDLAKDGAYEGFIVVIGQFYPFEMSPPVKALQRKGFTVKLTSSEVECAQWLDDGSAHAAWIISGSGAPLAKLITAAKAFHQRGKGLFIFGDNDPFFTHANQILGELYQVRLSGDYIGQQLLHFGSASESYTSKGHFGAHLIFTGIEHLYEGTTICRPSQSDKFVTLATASDGNVCITVMDPIPANRNSSSSSSSSSSHGSQPGYVSRVSVGVDAAMGRICVDCAFTKLYVQWDDAGTARYIVNATCWIIGIERMTQAQINSIKRAANKTGKDKK